MPIELRKRTQKSAIATAPVPAPKKAARKPAAKKTKSPTTKRSADEKNQDIEHHHVDVLKQEPAAKKQKTAVNRAQVSASHPTKALTDDQDTMARDFLDGVIASARTTLQAKRLHQRGKSLTDDQDDRVKSFFDQAESQPSSPTKRSAGASPSRQTKTQSPPHLTTDQDERVAEFFERVESPSKAKSSTALILYSPTKRSPLPAHLTNDQDERAAQFFAQIETASAQAPAKKVASPLSPAKRLPLPARLTSDQDGRVAEFFASAESSTGGSNRQLGGRHRQLITSPQAGSNRQLKRSRSSSPSKIPVSKSNKKHGASLTDDVDDRVVEFYDNVVQHSTDIPLERLQDPLKAAKRKIIGNELRRMSQASSHLAPHEVKALVMKHDQHSQIAAAQTHESIVHQIDQFGPAAVKNVLKGKKRNNATPAARPAKKARTQIVTAAVDSKRAKRNSIKELHDLVSPLNRDHRPSVVKTKVTVKKVKTEVNAEIMKTATLRQIRKLGNNWNKVLTNHV